MSIELGIAITPSPTASATDGPATLARLVEAGGLHLVVVDGSSADGDGGTSGLDPWTLAVFIAGATDHLQVGVAAAPADPTGAAEPFPAVVAKAHESLDVLAGTRLLAHEPGWVTAPPDADREQLVTLAGSGLPVVVPVRTPADVTRLATLLAELSDGGDAGSSRSAAVRSRRRPGIAYDDVPSSLAAGAVEPGDPGYRSVRSTYLRRGSPGLVLRPHTASEVADALAFARRHRHLPLGIRSGGHGISGRSTNDGGIVIDVGGIDGLEVLDPERRLVRVGPGATWKQVAAALDPYGWAIGSGDYGGVGVGGLATAGGIGYLSRNHGLTIDHLRAVELVLADGSAVRASADENTELFWAVRGAGANFGVATAFEFEAAEVGEIGFAQLQLVTTDIEQALRRYGQLASTAPRDTTVFLVTGPPRQGRSTITLYVVVDDDDPDLVVERLTPFTELGVLFEQHAAMTRYTDVMGLAADVGPDGHQGWGEPASRSGFLPALTDDYAHDAAELLRSGQVYFFQLRAMGGAIADTPADATAFGSRTPAFQNTVMGPDQAGLDRAWDALARHVDGLYLSFDTDRRPERLQDAFPPPVLDRLRRLKRRYDPDDLFRDNFNIHPGLDTGDGAEDPTDTTAGTDAGERAAG